MSKQLSPNLQFGASDGLALCKRMKNMVANLTTRIFQFTRPRSSLFCSIVLLGTTLAAPLHGQIPGYIGILPYRPGYDANLLYDNQTGTVEVFSTPNLSGMAPFVSTGWGNTWTHIIPGNFGGGASSFSDFLFYDEGTGIAEFYSCHYNGTSLSWVLLKRYTDWSSGHTIIVPGNFGGTSVTGQTDLLIYDAATGGAGFFDIWGQANINLMKSYKFSPGHTIMVPGNFGGSSATGQTDLLIYDGTTGSAGFFDIWGQANVNLMKSYKFSPGHTIIVPGNFGGIGLTDLLIYDGATGGAGFFDIWGQANINLMKSYNNWSPGHSFIIPGDFGVTRVTGQTDLIVYDQSTGNGGAFDVWRQGNLNYVGPFTQNHHWSLITTSFEVVPQISTLSPLSGGSGTPVTIKGVNLNGASRVQVGATSTYSGTNVSFSGNSSTTVTATMSPALTGHIVVTTPAGRDVSPATFTALAPLVTVPNVVGLTLQVAEQTLQQDGLGVGSISGGTGSNFVVISQSPGAGAQVNSGSPVSLVVQAPVQSGFKSVILTNYLSSGDSVYVWLYNWSNGLWTLENGGTLLGYGQSATVSVPIQTTYGVYDVDPNWCSSLDPRDTTCVPWEWTFNGNPQGSTVSVPMY